MSTPTQPVPGKRLNRINLEPVAYRGSKTTLCAGCGHNAITERIKWNAPSFGVDGDDRVTFKLHPPDRLQLVVHRGAKARDMQGFTFADPSGLVRWVAPDRGVVTLRSLDEIAARLAKNDYRFSELVLGIVKSTPFQKRRGDASASGE